MENFDYFDEEQVIGFDALYDSAMKCKSGVVWKDSVAHYMCNVLEETAKLEMQLHDGTYKERPSHKFIVTSPKRREVVSISFRDRVYQRSLNDNAVHPCLAKGFIYDNAACQKGKGTDFARGRLVCHLQKMWRKCGNDFFVLQCDIKKYYDNMTHQSAKDAFRKKLPANIYKRAEAVLDTYPGDRGYNPGSQMIQNAGLAVLDGLDHYCKERLRAKYYVRYMDDIIILAKTKEEAEIKRKAISDYLAGIWLELHPEKTKVYPVNCGIVFLGLRFNITDTGKVLKMCDPKKVKYERRKLKKLVKKVQRGEMTREKADQSFESWKAHIEKGNSWHLLNRMDEYYRRLWDDPQENVQFSGGGEEARSHGGRCRRGERKKSPLARRDGGAHEPNCD